jgi:type IV secretory pathway protease TraF
VVVELEHTLSIGRVIAVGGQTVRFFDGRPTIVGRPIRRRPLTDLRVPRFDTTQQARLAGLTGFAEENRQRRYIVTYSRELRTRPTASVRLAADEIYVLGDNRDAALKSSILGRIHLSAVRGRPHCIWASTDPSGAARAGRAGLQVR